MFQVVVVLKALTEIAAVAMFGQGVLWVLAGRRRDQNIVYQLFRILTSPVMKFTRWVMPRIVLDRHLWLVAILLLAILWITLTVFKIKLAVGGTAPA